MFSRLASRVFSGVRTHVHSASCNHGHSHVPNAGETKLTTLLVEKLKPTSVQVVDTSGKRIVLLLSLRSLEVVVEACTMLKLLHRCLLEREHCNSIKWFSRY